MKGYKFLRTETYKFKKLGGTKKKLKWRRARGRHNKIREKIRGRNLKPTIGFKKPESEKIKIKMIECLRDIEQAKKGEKVMLARIGGKKRKIFTEQLKGKGVIILN